MGCILRRGGWGVVASLMLAPAPASSHAIIGDRLFPSTLAIDDPGISDEASLPTFTRSVGADGTVEHDIGFDFTKTITPKLAVFVGDAYSHFGGGVQGLQNVQVGAKYGIYGNAEHETLIAVGFAAEVGGTGNVAFANRFSTVGPQIYAGKGFGDLPRSLDALRPLAVTGQFGLAVPTRSSTFPMTSDANDVPGLVANATVLNWGFSLQYSLLYLNDNIHKLAAPDVFARMIPTVEIALRSPIANVPQGGHTTLGTVQPGLFYEGGAYQIGVEALLPVNEASGRHPGVVAQLHFFFEDIFPKSLGRPLFGGEDGGEGHHHHGGDHGDGDHADAGHADAGHQHATGDHANEGSDPAENGG